jgi:hypothetical protein
MDDMTAFERQVAGEFVRRAGPVRPVDAASIFVTLDAAQPHRWRFAPVFSAARFIVAGVFVALFGGVLLAGLLTQSDRDAGPAGTVGSPITPEPARTEASAPLGWERVAIPSGVDPRAPLRSSGTRLIASGESGVRVSGDGSDWADPRGGGVLAAYDGTLLVRVPHELSTVPLDPQATIADAGLLQLESLQLPSGGFFPDAAALGPHGVVIAACDPACVTSTVWHTADGRAWTEVYRSEGELWAEVVALPDGFVALADRQDDQTFRLDPAGDPFVLFSADGVEWSRIDPADGARYELAGRSPFGAILEVMGLEAGSDPDGHGVVVASAAGLRPLDGWQDLLADAASSPSGTWGAGALGVVGVLADERVSVMTDDGLTWHRSLLPDDVPDRLGTQSVHVADDVALLQVFHCQDAAGLDVSCEDPAAATVSSAWFRGTRSTDGADASPASTDASAADADTSASDVLSTLETEQVAPGVIRVLTDGVRDLEDVSGLAQPAEAGSDGECGEAFFVAGECWASWMGLLAPASGRELPPQPDPDAPHGLSSEDVAIGPLPGSGDSGWLIVTGPDGFQGLLGYDAAGWTRVPYATGEDGRELSIGSGSSCGVVLGPERHRGLVGPDGTVWLYTADSDGLHVTTWDGSTWSSYGPVDIRAPRIENPCLLLDVAFGPEGTMWFTTDRIPLYVIDPKAVAAE